MKQLYKLLDSISDTLFLGQKVILAILATVIVVVNVSGVFARYIFHSGISWSQEVSIAIFMTMIFLGANIAMKTDSEIRIDLVKINSPKGQLIFSTVIDIICLALLGFLFVSSVASVINAIHKPQMLSTVKISYTVIYSVMPVGFFLMFFDKMTTMLRRIYDKDKVMEMKNEQDELSNTDR